ncbi:uncharacterized protein K452DRAFT_90611 [Aplosporella prunicola CBS 121167]|uniref:Uncharacterized protein n=1 Tax=Aplosporella prunicola CBS 121167 TaxID=1176127 RepID=A0A6A6B201_9PEZI|nr:uncharacterized protein K452DRAFT_90611 [Aplosporella prunicola CBS 121167]KAF2138242.1 hypothetical protein K452DRAFT_90611 [Aplosporella prunicola CBS 121167]
MRSGSVRPSVHQAMVPSPSICFPSHLLPPPQRHEILPHPHHHHQHEEAPTSPTNPTNHQPADRPTVRPFVHACMRRRDIVRPPVVCTYVRTYAVHKKTDRRPAQQPHGTTRHKRHDTSETTRAKRHERETGPDRTGPEQKTFQRSAGNAMQCVIIYAYIKCVCVCDRLNACRQPVCFVDSDCKRKRERPSRPFVRPSVCLSISPSVHPSVCIADLLANRNAVDIYFHQ